VKLIDKQQNLTGTFADFLENSLEAFFKFPAKFRPGDQGT